MPSIVSLTCHLQYYHFCCLSYSPEALEEVLALPGFATETGPAESRIDTRSCIYGTSTASVPASRRWLEREWPNSTIISWTDKTF